MVVTMLYGYSSFKRQGYQLWNLKGCTFVYVLAEGACSHMINKDEACKNLGFYYKPFILLWLL